MPSVYVSVRNNYAKPRISIEDNMSVALLAYAQSKMNCLTSKVPERLFPPLGSARVLGM